MGYDNKEKYKAINHDSDDEIDDYDFANAAGKKANKNETQPITGWYC